MRSRIEEHKMANPNDDAAKPRKSENDNMKPGSPPRPATEPAGSAASQNSGKTLTDPGSGAPNPGR